MKKIFFFIIFCLANICNLSAQTVVASGTAGPLTWTLYSSGTLNIGGNGDMPNLSLGSYSWYPYRSNITTIELSNGVKSIGSSAFAYCPNLTSINIPSSVTSIASNIFYNSSKLTSINVANDNANYSSENGVLFNKDKTVLLQCPGGKIGSYIIPNSVTSIAYSAFIICSNLTSITIPISVTSIGDFSFAYCSSLISIAIPNSVINIGEFAFTFCSSLTSITIPNSVTSIRNSTFTFCSSLTSITIPNSVTSIGNGPFSSCSSLTSITIPNSVTSIGNGLFSSCSSLTSITVSWNKPLTINSNVFSYLNVSAITLYVPSGTKSAYQANEVWGKFNIIEMPPPSYTITASAGSNGSISPSGTRTVNSGGNQTFYFYPNTGYEINQVLVDGYVNTSAATNGNYTFSNVTANHTISVSFKQSCISNIVVQVWDDVLSVVNNPANNGGYTFTAYQWRKNGIDIPGEISGNLYVPEPDGDSYYSVLLTTSNGQHLQTCPLSLRNVSGNNISAYPNPTEGKLTIESAGIRAGDIISVYSASGMLVRQFQAEAKETSIINIASLEKGIYFIKVNDKQVKILKNNK